MEQYIIFMVYNQSFAISISEVERIIEYIEPNKEPETSDYFLGVIQYDERILPIIDLNMRLYNQPLSNQNDPKIIVALWKGNYLGLLVDEVQGVRSFDKKQFEETNKEINMSQKYVTGFIKEDDIIIVLNTEQMFLANKEEELLLVLDS